MSVSVFYSLEEACGRFGPCALAIGNFDGVHAGHRELLRKTSQFARAHNLIPAVLTFDPHPTAIVAPERVPQLISPLPERIRLLAEAGAEQIFVLRFTPEIARLEPEAFVAQFLVNGLRMRAVFVGDNFRFGHRQSGTCDLLAKFGARYDFSCSFLEPVYLRGTLVSSSAIRSALTEGDVAKAGRLLGRCFAREGPVVSGRGIGSKQAVPTLNLRPDPQLIVPHGIFVTETSELDGSRSWPSVTSCGYNPTFGATDLTIETYLLRPLEGDSPRHIRVDFRYFLRHEEKYPDAASLKAQIMKDVARSETYWRRVERLVKAAPSIY